MHQPTDITADTTTFFTPVLEHWLERNSLMGSPRWIDPTIHGTVRGRSTKELHFALANDRNAGINLSHQSRSTGCNEKLFNGSTMRDRSDYPLHHISHPGYVVEKELQKRAFIIEITAHFTTGAITLGCIPPNKVP